MSAWSGRLPPSSLTFHPRAHHDDDDKKHDKLLSVVSDLRTFVNDLCSLASNTVVMSPDTLAIIDNHRFAHCLSAVTIPPPPPQTSTLKPVELKVQQVAFSLSNSPELDAALFEAANHPFYAEITPFKHQSKIS